ncbi:MAG: LysE family translocator [Bauldia sp.]|uniref:LysE family translocator n=1 Tax=Bauldia sp. TaxID=2575872 RepID=UPI001DE23420|nr:LysE family translocator [Bauldia sp.]MCB1496992.1 LysE family translocator [Bauldia sp.]
MLADFVPALPVLAAYAVAAIILSLTPGPDMTFFLSRTVSQSRAAGLAAFGGASTGLVIHSVLIAAGLSVLLAASVTAFTILKVVGAAYLAYLAWDAIRHGSALSLDKKGRVEALRSVYLKGLMVNLLNPKIIVFFVTFLPQFVSPADPEAAKKLLFLGLFFAVVNVPICVGLILFADRIAGFLKRSPRATRIVDWAFATVLGAFAIRLVLAESR